MTNIILESIYFRLIELSDLVLQRKLWLNQNNDTGLISSYSELMNSLFDDFNFDDFIDQTVYQIGFPDSDVLELNKLRHLLNSYSEKESDIEILNDNEWEKVVKQAKIVVNNWDKFILPLV